MSVAPLGIFDSGLGGVSILLEIRKILPGENIIYIADSANCPYGSKPLDEIRERTLEISECLTAQGAKALVVACNTACSAGLDLIRQKNPDIPVIGVEPAVKPAHDLTRSGKIGVLGTTLTLSGERFSLLVEKFGSGVEIITQPAPGLPDAVEHGMKDAPETEELLNRYIQPLLARGIDTLVLGCTHYPFLTETIRKICGPEVTILDTGRAVARQTERVLRYKGLNSTSHEKGSVVFKTTGTKALTEKVLATIWPETPVEVEEIKI